MDSAHFLTTFHARCPGVTSLAYARGRVIGDGRSSYELLADQVPRKARTLDLGCGDGHLLDLLAARGIAAIGIDPSPAELALARGHVVCGRGEQLPFADRSFGAVVSHLALSILVEPAPAIAELARVLVPGGTLAIVTGGGPGDDDAFAWFVDLLGPVLARSARKPPRLGDKRMRYAEGLDRLLAVFGFAPVVYERHTVDLGGTWDQVWATLASVYELAVVDDVAPLRDQLAARVGRSFDLAQVPCTMRIGLAVTTLRTGR